MSNQNGVTRLSSLELREGVLVENKSVATHTTTGIVTFSGAELLGGLILRDPNGAGRADKVPTAANLMLALNKPTIGASFEFTIRNTANGDETITLTTNTGATMSGTMTIAQNNTKRFMVVVNSPTAYTVYSLGTVVH